MDFNRWDGVAVLLYFLIAVVFMLPMVLNPSGVIMGSSNQGDVGMGLQVLVHAKDERTHNPLFNAPFGSNVSQYGSYTISNYLISKIVDVNKLREAEK